MTISTQAVSQTCMEGSLYGRVYKCGKPNNLVGTTAEKSILY